MVLVVHGSNGDGQSAWKRVEWMVCHSDHKHLPQTLLFAIYHFSEYGD